MLLSIGEVPSVYMPSKEVRQWRETILHRKKIVTKVVQVKNRLRATFKGQGYSRPLESGSWWKKSNTLEGIKIPHRNTLSLFQCFTHASNYIN